MLGFPDREALSLMSAKRMGCLKSNGCMGGLKLGIAEGGGIIVDPGQMDPPFGCVFYGV